MNIAKRGGGNVTQIIRTTAEVISNKVETMQEMLTMLQGRRLGTERDGDHAVWNFSLYRSRLSGIFWNALP